MVLLPLLNLFALAVIQGRIDLACRNQYCTELAIQKGNVEYIDPTVHRTLTLGKFFAAAAPLVPPTEAALAESTSPAGWRIVVSAFLYHHSLNFGDAGTHVRFINPQGHQELPIVR